MKDTVWVFPPSSILQAFPLPTQSTCPLVSECCPRRHSEVLALCWDGEPRVDRPPNPSLLAW